jgi:PAS domain-containing protein
VLEALNEAIRNKSVFEIEHRVRRVDGTLGKTLSRAIPLLDEKREVIEWIGAAKDITTQRQAEETIAARTFRTEVGQD